MFRNHPPCVIVGTLFTTGSVAAIHSEAVTTTKQVYTYMAALKQAYFCFLLMRKVEVYKWIRNPEKCTFNLPKLIGG